ncbi:hypothetical protein B0H14DRAFT_2567948 [Mycena olivaceomarginata]|nr:hypothetical protein B0H14DRAFT_2567948 [Mycena olivaceomarginata]
MEHDALCARVDTFEVWIQQEFAAQLLLPDVGQQPAFNGPGQGQGFNLPDNNMAKAQNLCRRREVKSIDTRLKKTQYEGQGRQREAYTKASVPAIAQIEDILKEAQLSWDATAGKGVGKGSKRTTAPPQYTEKAYAVSTVVPAGDEYRELESSVLGDGQAREVKSKNTAKMRTCTC